MSWRKRFFRQALLSHFQLEIADDLDEIGVSTPLSVSVDGPLDHPDPVFSRKEGIGDSKAGIIVDMNAHSVGRDECSHFPDNSYEVCGHCPAVRVAKDDMVCAAEKAASIVLRA